MKTQLWIAAGIVLVGSALLGGEYFLVNWYPLHKQRVAEETLKLLPYRNENLGIEMQIASGIYGKIESLPDGVRIYRPRFWSVGPSLTITSQLNPGKEFEFSPQVLAKWQSRGALEDIPRYNFSHEKINHRDAALIWQLKDHSMLVTAHIISPERIVEANCSTGLDDQDLYLRACEETLRSIKVAGPEPPAAPPPVYNMPRK
jgi:hypothetical protein